MRKLLCGLLAVGWLAFSWQAVNAHGYGKQVVKQEAVGPYTVSVWIDPFEVENSEPMHVTVSIEENAEIVTGADVKLTAVHQDDATDKVSTQATHDQSVIKVFYEGQLTLKNAGDWEITVAINGDQGAAETQFSVTVLEDTQTALIKFLGILSGGLTFLGLSFYVLRKKSSKVKD